MILNLQQTKSRFLSPPITCIPGTHNEVSYVFREYRLYMPDYKNEPTGIKQLMPWSDKMFRGNRYGKRNTRKSWEPANLRFPRSRARVIMNRLRKKIREFIFYEKGAA